MILVLEDDRYTREAISLFLDYLEIDHKVSSTAEEAIEIMKEYAITTFLVDMVLSFGDASPAVRYCQNRYKRCKVVLITALNQEPATRVAKELKVDHLLLKPFDLDRLASLLS